MIQQSTDREDATDVSRSAAQDGYGGAGIAAGPTPNDELILRERGNVAWGNLAANLYFLRCAAISPGANILEIGCGKGSLLNHLQLAGYAVHGVDLDRDALSSCRAQHPDASVCVASGDALPFPSGAFDAVVSFDVFEHIKASDLHLAEVRRILRPGGRYLLQTPNKWTNIPFELIRQWKKFHTGPIESYREIIKDHCALHNYWELQRRFARNGFDITFFDVPVVNDYFKEKMRTYLGAVGPWLIGVFNPDHLPRPLRTNFYAVASLR